MAEVTTAPRVNALITLTLDEGEARALAALASFGSNAVLERLGAMTYDFQDNVNRTGQHAPSMRRLLESVRTVVPPYLEQVDAARAAFAAAKR